MMKEILQRKGVSVMLTLAAVASACGGALAQSPPAAPIFTGGAGPSKSVKPDRAPFKGAPVNIAGSIIYSGTNRMDGLYSFATDAKELTPIVLGEKYNASMGGVMAEGRYFSAYQVDWWGVMQDNYNYLFDATGWQTLRETNEAPATNLATALAYDPVTKKVYGCFYGENGGGEFATINIYTFERSETITSLSNLYEAMGFTSSGQLYAIDSKANLLKVDKNTGSSVVVGNTGIGMKYRTSGGIDTRTDRFFFAACNDSEKAIYQIDLNTAAATFVCDMPEDSEIAGMWFPEPLAKDKAPAAVSNMSVSFNQAELTGQVSFTAPVTLYDGSSASGALTYTVKADGVTLASGETTCGQSVTTSITVPRDDMFKITVSVANSVGSGPEVYKSLFIGKDTPSKVRDVSLTRNGNWNTVTWSKVTTMVNGGYINPSQVTYTITRYPDNEVVKTGEKNAKFMEFIESTSNGEPCYYEVVAEFNGVRSAPGKSNSFALGVLNVPFTEKFVSRADFNKWLSIDGNGNNRAWDFGGNTDQNAFCYNSLTEGVPMNAWLISPGIWMEAGRQYTLSFDVHSQNDGVTSERLEVAYGKEASIDGMANTLIEPMIVNYKAYRNQEVTFSVTENGVYYIGFHGCSDPKTYFIYVDNVAMTASEPARTAMEPKLVVTPSASGALTAVVEVTLPDLTAGGEPLEAIDKLEIKRGEEIFKEVENPKPGSMLKYLDELPAEGYYEYSATAYTSDGPGKTASVNVYVGVNIPGAPEWVKASVGSAEGKVKLTWKEVDKTVDGLPASPSLMTYDIYDKEGNKLKSDIKGSTTELDVEVPAQGQKFMAFAVRAVTSAGEGRKATLSDLFPVGQAYRMPLSESFGNKSASISLAQGRDSEGQWGFSDAVNTPPCSSQDDDGGMLLWVPSGENTSSSIFTGKIYVDENASKPMFSFYYFGVAASSDVISPLLVDLETAEKVQLGESVQLKDGTGWTKVSLPLDAYKGKNIQLGFGVTSNTYEYIICLDNLRVLDQKGNDLAAVKVSVPEVMMVNMPSEITVEVENIGENVARDYTVELFRNGNRVAESSPATLGVDVKGTVTFKETPDATFPDELEYYAVVKLEGDENLSNNTSAVSVAKVGYNSLPTVSDLRALRYDEAPDVTLEWSVVEAGSEFDEIENESFENAVDFSVNYGDWTFVDKDGKKTYGIEGMPFPGSGQPMAFIVMNDTHSSFNSSFAASHGHKYLAAFCPESGRNDDWAISPELSGNSQKVSFDAKSYTTEFGQESFEFLYSDAGNDIDEFKLLDSKFVPGSWTSYEFELPQGARYFAVRCISDQKFIFMIDNFKYEVKRDLSGVSVVGYNLYRDNMRVNTAPIAENRYVDKGVVDDNHTYRATVVYSTGESRKGNEAVIVASGIDMTFAASAFVRTVDGGIIISDSQCCDYLVAAVDGKVMASGKASSGETRVALMPGVYVVRFADGKTFKVVVR